MRSISLSPDTLILLFGTVLRLDSRHARVSPQSIAAEDVELKGVA